jgi:hypothetical protein
VAYFEGGLQRKFDNSLHWVNSLQLRFGQTHNKRLRDDGSSGWDKPEKTEDRVDLETLLLLEKGWKVDPYVSGRWESFFLDESDPRGDIAINPNTFRESIGVAKHFAGSETEEDKQRNLVLTRLGGTARQSFRRFFDSMDNIQADGGVDGGVELQADWRLRMFGKKLSWRGKASLYQPFWWSKADEFDKIDPDSLTSAGIASDVKDLTTNLDFGWQNTFTTQITQYIAFSLYVEFVWDEYDNSVVPEVDDSGNLLNPELVRTAVRKDWQWKQSIGVGFIYKFSTSGS